MKITVVGGGNVGTQIAVHCAEKGHEVIVYSSKYDKFNKHLMIVDETGTIVHEGDILFATNDAKQAFSNANIIFVTLPAFCMQEIADTIKLHVCNNTKIGIIPGTGGGECAFKDCMLEKECVIFGMQRVPSVARLVEYGKCVCAKGYRKELHVAAMPRIFTQDCCDILSEIFDMTCIGLPNYLNLTLTPSNPVLHTTRLYTLFKEYTEGTLYDDVPLFYEEWNDETSDLLIKCDDEVQLICRQLREFDLSFVKSLKVHYESRTIEEMTKKISGIESFKGLNSPVVNINNKYIPDFNSRYFTADFPYGLSILVQIAKMVNVDVPNMITVLEWYRHIVGDTKYFDYTKYGIIDRNTLVAYYNC